MRRSRVVCVIVPRGLVTQALEDIELDCDERPLVIEGQSSSGLKRIQEDGTAAYKRSVISEGCSDMVHGLPHDVAERVMLVTAIKGQGTQVDA